MSRQKKKGTIAILAIIAVALVMVVPNVHAHKLTASSYDDGFARGQTDARRDYYGMNGHGYDSSCPSGHTDVYCSGYVRGYRTMYAELSGSSDGGSRPVNQRTDQAQGSSVNIKGNNNKVNLHQGQASSQSTAYGVGRGLKHFFDGLSDPEDPSNYNGGY